MKTLGRHLLVELYGCSPSAADDPATVLAAMRAGAAAIGATVVGECVHRYAPQGVSGLLAISESHVSVHTWPEAGYVALDIFTCGGLEPADGVGAIATALGATSSRAQEIVRGLAADVPPRLLRASDVLVLSQVVEALPLTAVPSLERG